MQAVLAMPRRIMAGVRIVDLHTLMAFGGIRCRMRHGVVHVRVVHRTLPFMLRRCRGMPHRAGRIHHPHAGMALYGDAEAEQANHE